MIAWNGEVAIQRYRIIGSDEVVYRAWEPVESYDEYHAVSSLNGCGKFGSVESRRPSADVLALPLGSHERIQAVDAHYRDCQERAYSLIRGAVPELRSAGRERDGHITLQEEVPA